MKKTLHNVKIVATFHWLWVCQPHQASLNLKKTPNSKIVTHKKNKKINLILKHAQKS